MTGVDPIERSLHAGQRPVDVLAADHRGAPGRRLPGRRLPGRRIAGAEPGIAGRRGEPLRRSRAKV